MFKPAHVSIVALLALLTVSFACQKGEAPGESISPAATTPNKLVVAYTTNNDGEIDPCG